MLIMSSKSSAYRFFDSLFFRVLYSVGWCVAVYYIIVEIFASRDVNIRDLLLSCGLLIVSTVYIFIAFLRKKTFVRRMDKWFETHIKGTFTKKIYAKLSDVHFLLWVVLCSQIILSLLCKILC